MVEGENARQAHWEKAYRRTEAEARSWYQKEPARGAGLKAWLDDVVVRNTQTD